MKASPSKAAPYHRPFREGFFEDGGQGAIKLLGGRCLQCSHISFPKKEVCPSCLGLGGQEDVSLGPFGTLYTFAVVRRAPTQFPTPYVIGYVDLDEGVRVFGRIQVEDPTRLRLHARMELISGVLDAPTDEPRGVYMFRPLSSDGPGDS